jgi:hypothetical protein
VVVSGTASEGSSERSERKIGEDEEMNPRAEVEEGIVVLYMREKEDAEKLLLTLKRVQSYDHRRGVSDHNDRHYAIDGIIDALENRRKVE